MAKKKGVIGPKGENGAVGWNTPNCLKPSPNEWVAVIRENGSKVMRRADKAYEMVTLGRWQYADKN